MHVGYRTALRASGDEGEWGESLGGIVCQNGCAGTGARPVLGLSEERNGQSTPRGRKADTTLRYFGFSINADLISQKVVKRVLFIYYFFPLILFLTQSIYILAIYPNRCQGRPAAQSLHSSNARTPPHRASSVHMSQHMLGLRPKN